jgi:hypothetical protein
MQKSLTTYDTDGTDDTGFSDKEVGDRSLTIW